MSTSVLVVDDDRAVQRLLQLFLQSTGHTVTCVGCPEEALRRLACESFDVVISDLIMPRIDGIELAGCIRALPHGVDIPIILLTALDDRETRIRASGVVGELMVKPVDLLELSLRIDRLVRDRKERIAARDGLQLAENGNAQRTFSSDASGLYEAIPAARSGDKRAR